MREFLDIVENIFSDEEMDEVITSAVMERDTNSARRVLEQFTDRFLEVTDNPLALETALKEALEEVQGLWGGDDDEID